MPKGKKISQYTLDDEFIKEYTSKGAIIKEFKTSHQTLSNILDSDTNIDKKNDCIFRYSIIDEEKIDENDKKCSKCNTIKSKTEFNKNKNQKDGYNAWCKNCMTEYRNNNLDKRHEYDKKFREKHHETELERQKQYRENNQDKIKAYNEKNKERKSETDRKWRDNNKEKKKELDKKYRLNNQEKIKKNKKEQYEKVKNTEEYKEKRCNYIKNRLKNDQDFNNYLSTFMGTDISSYQFRKSIGMDFIQVVFEKLSKPTFKTVIQNPPYTKELKDPQLYLKRIQ